MRHIILILSITLAVIGTISCTGRKSQQPVSSAKTTGTVETPVNTINGEAHSKVGPWVQKGTECYGIVIGYFADGRTLGKAVKCKVMALKPDKVKMKTIESVSLLEGEGCDKMGLAYGDTWWEEEGDIFRTREEAEAYLKEKGWMSK